MSTRFDGYKFCKPYDGGLRKVQYTIRLLLLWIFYDTVTFSGTETNQKRLRNVMLGKLAASRGMHWICGLLVWRKRCIIIEFIPYDQRLGLSIID